MISVVVADKRMAEAEAEAAAAIKGESVVDCSRASRQNWTEVSHTPCDCSEAKRKRLSLCLECAREWRPKLGACCTPDGVTISKMSGASLLVTASIEPSGLCVAFFRMSRARCRAVRID